MKKISILFIGLFLTGIPVFSQKRSVGYVNAGAALFAPWNYHADAAFFPAFTLTPGIKFLQDSSFALILNFPISAGLTYKSDAFAGIDLPAMLSVNIGSASGNAAHAKFGIVLAGGVAYMNVVNHYDDNLKKKIHTEFWGYRLNAGVSFKQDSGVIPSVICSYGSSISRHRGSVIGIGLQLIVKGL